jgi:hypothetical protein
MARGGKRFGAGRPGWRSKVEDCGRFDVRQLGRGGPWANGATLTFKGRGESICQSVAITHTACGFGGHRAWFVCPACDARAATLFVAGHHLACRSCHGLAYRSQSLGVMGAAFARMFHHMLKLGPDFTKPKGMHGRTYLRLLASAHHAMVPASLVVAEHMRGVRRDLKALGIQGEKWGGFG